MAQRRYPATQNQSRLMGESVLETLRRLPFGALPKSELDLALFRALIDSGVLDLGMPQFELARRLEITPARVRGLVYRYRLEHQDDDRETLDQITAALGRSRFELTAGHIVFGIEDPYLRDSLAALLKSRGYYSDSSFNPETVTMSIAAFVDFADQRLSDDDRRAILRALQKDTGVELSAFKRIVKSTLTALGKRVVGAAAEDAASGLVDAAWDFVSGLLHGKPAQIEPTQIEASHRVDS